MVILIWQFGKFFQFPNSHRHSLRRHCGSIFGNHWPILQIKCCICCQVAKFNIRQMYHSYVYQPNVLNTVEPLYGDNNTFSQQILWCLQVQFYLNVSGTVNYIKNSWSPSVRYLEIALYQDLLIIQVSFCTKGLPWELKPSVWAMGVLSSVYKYPGILCSTHLD